MDIKSRFHRWWWFALPPPVRTAFIDVNLYWAYLWRKRTCTQLSYTQTHYPHMWTTNPLFIRGDCLPRIWRFATKYVVHQPQPYRLSSNAGRYTAKTTKGTCVLRVDLAGIEPASNTWLQSVYGVCPLTLGGMHELRMEARPQAFYYGNTNRTG